MQFSSNPKILNKYLEYLLNVRCFSKGTVEGYNNDILGFFKFIKEEQGIAIQIKDFNIFILSQIKSADIISFMIYLNIYRNNSPATRKRKLTAIKGFFNWLSKNYSGNIYSNPSQELPIIEGLIRLPKYLKFNEVQKIKDIFTEDNCRFPERNNAIISLFLSSGMRLSELQNINLKDVNFINNTIRIVGKGNKERIVYFNNNCKKRIREYLNIKNKNIQLLKLDQPLFVTKKNERLSGREIQYICEKAYKLSGLDGKGYSTHTLRHTAATLLYMYSGEDILLIKNFLGHSSIASTEIYTHVHSEKIKEAVNKNPLSNFFCGKNVA